MAVNSRDSQSIIVCAASNPWKSYSIPDLESFVYRGSSDDEKWNIITGGIPISKGTVISVLESNPNRGDEFYCLNS
ncbi:hypothetical protein [Candidatus Nitrosocosmicus arcticus]|uniref:Uncharacterized protein n=1 Tax=Candidatus Nitrosocosmicus arcticus TaxID=2035267 RepID=A0A557SY93_9ARCH|nr:hypothetical protein [Candidatus Nitrosocosmicus arcticus]TVP41562.1 hypothetical protein NARC_30277 [Candidatus Nitrosocosmicus arcticus]